MSAAIWSAGMRPWDITMSDLLQGRASLNKFKGVALLPLLCDFISASLDRFTNALLQLCSSSCAILEQLMHEMCNVSLGQTIQLAGRSWREWTYNQTKSLQIRIKVLLQMRRIMYCRLGICGRIQLCRRLRFSKRVGRDHQTQSITAKTVHRLLPKACSKDSNEKSVRKKTKNFLA